MLAIIMRECRKSSFIYNLSKNLFNLLNSPTGICTTLHPCKKGVPNRVPLIYLALVLFLLVLVLLILILLVLLILFLVLVIHRFILQIVIADDPLN